MGGRAGIRAEESRELMGDHGEEKEGKGKESD